VDAPPPEDEADLFVVPVQSVGALPHRGVPVIACGPPELLRAAFLAGCVDYLKEPWLAEELVVRAHAAVDRARRRVPFAGGTLALRGHDLSLPNGSVVLTRNEALILRALLRVRGQAVPREALAALLGVRSRAAASRTIDVQIAMIRRKVRTVAPEAGRLILCARGQGYLIP